MILYNIEIYFMMFIIYSIAGWVMECTLGVIDKHKFINRGFLIGPYCPIYGVGVISVSLFLSRFSKNYILLFLLACLFCGTLEYLTSYLMEKIFNARWWDYTRRKFNINGRVCLETLIPFGIISVLVICFVNPWLLNKLYQIPQIVLNIIVISFLVIYLIDLCVSFNVILKFKNLSKQEKDNTEEITKKVREAAEAAIEKLKVERDYLISKIDIKNFSLSPIMNYTRKKYTRNIKKESNSLINIIKVRIQGIDDKIKDIGKELSEKIANIKENQPKIFSKEIREKFGKQSKLNKRLISAFPNVEQKDYTRKKKK